MIVKDKKCFFCGNTQNLHVHHCISGTANRKKSEQYGLKIYVCHHHHNLAKKSIHQDESMNLQVKRFAQQYFLDNIGDMALWLKEFGKSWL